MGQPGNCPTSDPSLVHLSSLVSHGQTQDVEIATDLPYNDTSTRAPESNADIETAYKPMQLPPSRQSDNLSTPEINDPTTEKIPQNEPSHFRGGKDILSPNPNPNY